MAEKKQYPKRKFQYLKDDNEYKRPDKTFTEQLTKEQIAEKLIDYIQVDDMKFVKKGTHLRYYIPDKQRPGEMKFCVGGFLKFRHEAGEYVILAQSPYNDGTKSWSVQLKDATFYRKLSPQEIIDTKIHRLETENARLLKENEMLKAKHQSAPRVVPELNELDKLKATIEDLPDEFQPIKFRAKDKPRKPRFQ